VGRFEVLSELGAGGMGVVYAARDPELGRRVALKLLRPGRGSEGAQQRLLREAQALARLSHPNVVQVYEAGTQEGLVFLAMEFVEGSTLREHVARHRPALRALLGLYIEAARGLAAAHATGLSHRDFKPDNVLVALDGRVRVADFGLAAAHAETQPAPGESGENALLRMTSTGALLGTPAYMAPEQLRGERATGLSDQFSFCVSLWEAVAGRPPFAGDTVESRSRSVLAGVLVEPPPGAFPRWLDALLRRGLSTAPGARFPSMAALIAALEEGLPHEEARATRKVRVGLMALLLLFSWFFGSAVYLHGLPGPWAVAALGLPAPLIFTVAVFLLRRSLRKSALNWDFARLLLCMMWGMCLHRVAEAAQGAGSVALLSGDLVLIGMGLTVGSFLVYRPLLWSALGVFALLGLMLAYPGTAVLAFMGAINVIAATLIFAWQRK
jgi:serine/threonine-protein kinase